MSDFRCSDCDEPVGLIRVMKGDIRLGHLRQPSVLHPVRLASAARNGGIPVPSTGQPKVSGASDTSRTSIGTRAARNGRDRTASPPVATPIALRSGDGARRTSPGPSAAWAAAVAPSSDLSASRRS